MAVTGEVGAIVHLLGNFSYLLMAIPAIFIFPVTIIQYHLGWHKFVFIYLMLFFSTTVAVFVFYLVCQRAVHHDWLKRLRYILCMMACAIGLSINNSKAVLEALFNYQTEFKRTPKYRIENKKDNWKNKLYKADKNFLPFVEFLFGIYFSFSIYFAIKNHVYFSIPFFLLFQFGFFYISIQSLTQNNHWRSFASNRQGKKSL